MITTSLEIALVILTIEFAFIACVILFRSYRRAHSVVTKATQDATELVNKVSEAQEPRKLALETVFRDKYQYEGEELTKTVDEFMQRERAFYNAVVSVFLGRDKKKLSDLNGELTRVIAPWISITPKNMVDSSEVESLAADNARLESELKESKVVLEEMIEEYNRTFHASSSAKGSADTSQDKSVDTVEEEVDEVSGEDWDKPDANDIQPDDAEDLDELADLVEDSSNEHQIVEVDSSDGEGVDNGVVDTSEDGPKGSDIETTQSEKSDDDSESVVLDNVASDQNESDEIEASDFEVEGNTKEGDDTADSETSK